jgi:hypothetical protein
MENTTLPPTQITVADLDALRAIVDLAASRGAFRGAELGQIGAVYDKLTSFLNAVLAQAQADTATTDDADATADAEETPSKPTQGE